MSRKIRVSIRDISSIIDFRKEPYFREASDIFTRKARVFEITVSSPTSKKLISKELTLLEKVFTILIAISIASLWGDDSQNSPLVWVIT